MSNTVISVRGVNGPARATLMADPDFIYVGRSFAGWPGSIFGNPFKGAGAVDRFREGLRAAMDRVQTPEFWGTTGFREPTNDFDRMALALPKLQGKRLACWCGTWAPGQPDIACHAVVLAKAADQQCGIDCQVADRPK